MSGVVGVSAVELKWSKVQETQCVQLRGISWNGGFFTATNRAVVIPGLPRATLSILDSRKQRAGKQEAHPVSPSHLELRTVL